MRRSKRGETMPDDEALGRLCVVYALPEMERAGVRRDVEYARPAGEALRADVYTPAGAAPIELINHPTAQHFFDVLDHDDRSRAIIRRTLDFLAWHLMGM
jgi:hypothetical protein